MSFYNQIVTQQLIIFLQQHFAKYFVYCTATKSTVSNVECPSFSAIDCISI